MERDARPTEVLAVGGETAIAQAICILAARYSCSNAEAETRLQVATDGGEGLTAAEVAADIVSGAYWKR